MRKTALLLMLLALRATAQPGDDGEVAAVNHSIHLSTAVQFCDSAAVPAQGFFPKGNEQILYVHSWKPFDPTTMLVQAGCALLTETVAWFAGFYLFSGTDPGGLDRLAGMVLGGHLFAALVGAPAGAQLGGGLMRGNGKFLGTLAGGAVGTVLGLVTMHLLHDATNPWLIWGSMYAATTVPTIVGYHLTASPMNYYFYDDAPDVSARAERLSRTPAFRRGGSGFMRLKSATMNDPVHPRPDVQITPLQVSF